MFQNFSQYAERNVLSGSEFYPELSLQKLFTWMTKQESNTIVMFLLFQGNDVYMIKTAMPLLLLSLSSNTSITFLLKKELNLLNYIP